MRRTFVAIALALCMSALSLSVATAVRAQGACPVAGGTPNAQSCADEPASLPADGPDRGAGNPIDVVTGNKYERAVDHATPLDRMRTEVARTIRAAIDGQHRPWWLAEVPDLPGGASLDLSMVRHYNSRNQYTLSLGPGWSHGYDTRLARQVPAGVSTRRGMPAARLQILQADGRRIGFTAVHRPDRRTVRYRAIDVADGLIDEHTDPSTGERHWVWRWSGGRVLSFDAQGRLVMVRDAGGDRLTLRHDAGGRLLEVADDRGRQLRFEYYPPSLSPPRDEPSGYAGRLAAVHLPTGHRIGYRYDRYGALAEVDDATGRRTRYRYDSTAGFGYLTGIEGNDGRRARFA